MYAKKYLQSSRSMVQWVGQLNSERIIEEEKSINEKVFQFTFCDASDNGCTGRMRRRHRGVFGG